MDLRRVLQVSLATVAAAVIGAVAVPQFSSTADPAIDSVLVDLEMLRKVVAERRRASGALPNNESGLAELLIGSPPLLGKLPPDRWGHQYVYRRTDSAAGFVIYSVEKNGVDEFGQGDDVTDSSKPYPCETYGVNCPRTALDLVAYAIVVFGVLGLIGLIAWVAVAIYRTMARKSE